MILWSQTFLGSRWSWETQITVWLWISLNVQKTSENIRYCLFSVFYKALYSHVIYIFSILQRTLFLLSVACVVRLMQCSLPPSRRGPLPVFSVLLWLIYHPQIGIWQILTVSGCFWGKEGAFVMKLVIEDYWESGCQSVLLNTGILQNAQVEMHSVLTAMSTTFH